MQSLIITCLSSSLCGVTYMDPLACSLVLPPKINQYGVSNQSFDLPLNWVFTPPGTSCGVDSYAAYDNISSRFIYNPTLDLCETSFSPLSSNVEYSVVNINNIGQEITLHKRRLNYNTPLLLPIQTSNTGQIIVQKTDRCTSFPDLIYDAYNTTWIKTQIKKQVCSTEVEVEYRTTHQMDTSTHPYTENATHYLYEYTFGGISSLCGPTPYCLGTFSYTIEVLKEKQMDTSIALIVVLLATLVPASVTIIIGTVAALHDMGFF